MNPPGFSAAGDITPSSSTREVQLQGPRPPPLRVRKESHKIRKPPLPPHISANPLAMAEAGQQPQPVIIFSVSPKVINVTVSDFMSVVQRLTGPTAADELPLGSGDVSPAARLASIEKASPSEKDRVHTLDELMDTLVGVEMGQFHGILSPAPATLAPIPSEFFSPVPDPQMLSFLHELSPFRTANSFIASPSGLLSAHVISPVPPPDIFTIFD